MQYRAFISYSHAADSDLAAALQRALHGLARPWYRVRAFTVFRDQTSLPASSDLPESIRQALAASEFLILLASPQAASSPWIDAEVGYWVREKSLAKLILVLTDGTFVSESATGAFDAARSTALPPALHGTLRTVPLYVDLRGIREHGRVSLRNPRFHDAVATVAAALHGTTKEAIFGEDLREYRRRMRVAGGALVALAVLAVSTTYYGLEARQQARTAGVQTALARREAAGARQARNEADQQRETAEQERNLAARERNRLRLAEGGRWPPTQERLWSSSTSEGPWFSGDGSLVAVRGQGAGEERTPVLVLRASDGHVLLRGSLPEECGSEEMWRCTVLALAPGSTWATAVVSYAPGGGVEVRELATGRRLARFAPGRSAPLLARFGPGGSRLVTADSAGVVTWSVTPFRRVSAPARCGGRVTALALSGDGRVVVTADDTGLLCAFDAGSGREIGRLDYARAMDPSAAPGSGGFRPIRFVSLRWEISANRDGSRVGVGVVDDQQGSPSGRSRVVMWEPAARRQVVLPRWIERLAEVEVESTGSRILTVSDTQAVEVWDAERGALLHTMGVEGAIAAAFNADGTHVAVGYVSGAVEEWSAGTGRLLGAVHKDSPVRTVRYAGGGAVLVTGDAADKYSGSGVTGWRAHQTSALPMPPGDSGSTRTVVFSRDGARLLAFTEGGIRLWDTARHAMLWHDPAVPVAPPDEAEGGMPAQFVDGAGRRVRALVAGGAEGSWRLVEWMEGRREPVRLGAAHRGELRQVWFAPGLPRFVTAAVEPGGEVCIRLWHAATGASVATLECGAADSERRVRLDGPFVVEEHGNGAAAWDLATGRRIASANVADGRVLHLAPERGEMLFLRGRRGEERRLEIRGLRTRSRRLSVETAADWISAARTAQGDVAVLHETYGRYQNLALVDWSTGRKRFSTSVLGENAGTRVSADGRRVIVKQEVLRRADPRGVLLLDARNGDTLSVLLPSEEPVRMEISPDGKLVAIVGWRGQVSVWRVADGRQLRSWSYHTNGQASSESAVLEFSPDSRRLYLHLHGEPPRLWDMEREVPELRSAVRRVRSP